MTLRLAELVANADDEDARAILSELTARFDSVKRSSKAAFSADEQTTWDAITEAHAEHAFGSDSGRKPQPLAVFAKFYGVARYSEAALILTDIVNAGSARITDPLRRPVRREIERTLLRALVKWMAGRRIVVTPKTICEQMPNIRHAFEASYPGYLDAGMLHAVVRRKQAA